MWRGGGRADPEETLAQRATVVERELLRLYADLLVAKRDCGAIQPLTVDSLLP